MPSKRLPTSAASRSLAFYNESLPGGDGFTSERFVFLRWRANAVFFRPPLFVREDLGNSLEETLFGKVSPPQCERVRQEGARLLWCYVSAVSMRDSMVRVQIFLPGQLCQNVGIEQQNAKEPNMGLFPTACLWFAVWSLLSYLPTPTQTLQCFFFHLVCHW